MALDATVGGASSNSYGTLEEADDHFEDRPERLSWAALKMAQESWLIAATDVMETFTYQGRRAYTDQALSFPRSGLALDGIRLDADVIPVLVKRAQFVLALWLSEQDVLRDAVEDLDAFERLRVDVIELVPRDPLTNKRILPTDVQRSLSAFLASGGLLQFRIYRG